MPAEIRRLDPSEVWQHFADIARIPRPSKQEEAISKHVLELAAQHGCESEVDEAGNIVIRVPASPGREGAPLIALQSHLDMVCEKNEGTEHDFEKDPIRLRIDGDFVYATGTTLGADNGIGASAMLALMTSKDVVHGPLELLFTIDEETGLTGAQALKPGFLNAGTMLNLDSEEDGILYIGCAGGADTHVTLTPSWSEAKANQVAVELRVSGLSGGHSGLDIIRNRGNAVKITARALVHLGEHVPYTLGDLRGGNKHNAIPREATAQIWVDENKTDDVSKHVAAFAESIQAEFRGIDDGLKIDVSASSPSSRRTLDADDSERLVRLLVGIPHGVLAMSQAVEGLVETSNNLAVCRTDETVTILTSTRSSVASSLQATLNQVDAVASLAQASVEHGNAYPGWQPDPNSSILKVCQSVYERLFSASPEVAAIHAGLECGLIGKTYPEMEIISFGPLIEGAHSPDERVRIPSVAQFFTYLRAVLDQLSS